MCCPPVHRPLQNMLVGSVFSLLRLLLAWGAHHSRAPVGWLPGLPRNPPAWGALVRVLPVFGKVAAPHHLAPGSGPARNVTPPLHEIQSSIGCCGSGLESRVLGQDVTRYPGSPGMRTLEPDGSLQILLWKPCTSMQTHTSCCNRGGEGLQGQWGSWTLGFLRTFRQFQEVS